MGEPYQNTISGLLRKRAEMMGEAQQLREALAAISNDMEALDRVLETLGYEGDPASVMPSGHRVVFFARNELRRFCLDEMRKAEGPMTSRDLADKIITIQGLDAEDRKMRNEMVRRVGQSLKLLRKQGLARSQRNEPGHLVWSVVTG
jgi:hypothetical protein